MIKESETILEWEAEKPTDANEDSGVQNLEFVLQQMHTAPVALTSYEANESVANSQKNPLEAWRRLQKRYGPTIGGRTKTCCERSFLVDGSLFWNSKRGSKAGVLRVSLREEDEG